MASVTCLASASFAMMIVRPPAETYHNLTCCLTTNLLLAGRRYAPLLFHDSKHPVTSLHVDLLLPVYWGGPLNFHPGQLRLTAVKPSRRHPAS